MPVGGLVPKVAEAQIAEKGPEDGARQERGRKMEWTYHHHHHHQVRGACSVSPYSVTSKNENDKCELS